MSSVRSPRLRALAAAFVAGMTVLAGTATFAQPDAGTPAVAGPSAPEIAGLVQAFYDQTTTFEADFRQSQFLRAYSRTESARGRVVFKKPGMMRFDYAAPNNQVFVSDGSRLRIYQPPAEGEREGQLIERALNQDQLPAAFGFLMGTGRLDADFEARLLDPERREFPAGHVLELTPRQASPHFERLVLYVEIVTQAGRSAGVVKRLVIIDAAGNRNRFDFVRPRYNREVAAGRFRFEPPRNTRRVTG